jgi:hypothetical protein
MLPPFSLRPEDGASMVLRKVGILPQHYTVSQPRRPRHETALVSGMKIMHFVNISVYLNIHGR